MKQNTIRSRIKLDISFKVIFFMVLISMNISAKGSILYPPLHSAAANGFLESVKKLLSNGGDPNQLFYPAEERESRLLRGPKNKIEGIRPINLAASNGHIEVVEYLIEHGAKLKKPYPIIGAVNSGHIDIVKLLLKYEKSVNTLYDGQTLLHIASRSNRDTTAEYLISQGVEINALNKDNETPLLVAASNNAYLVIPGLLSHGADVSRVDKSSISALHFAVFKSNYQVIKMLLSYKANVNAVDQKLSTPIHYAVSIGHIEIIDLLASHGADLNIQNDLGQTPMHAAVKNPTKAREILEVLLKYNPDISLKDKQGLTVYDRASEDTKKYLSSYQLQKKMEYDGK